MLRRTVLSALTAIFLLSWAGLATAADSIALTWDANPSGEQVLGYIVYVGTADGDPLEVYDVGDQTTFVYSNAVSGQEYFFAVVAYSAFGWSPYSEVSGFANAPPTLVSPGDQKNSVGEAVAVQLLGSDKYGEPVTFHASDLPPGLTLSQSTGLISGAGTSVGIYAVTVTVTDGLLFTQRAFSWFIDGSPPSVTITSPTTQVAYSASGSATLALAGSANDDLGLSAVTWVNDGGGAGTANGTSPWSIAAVPLKLGNNVITVTARDVVDKTATAVITVTYNNPPTLPNPGDRLNAEADVVSLQLAGSDPDGDAVTYSYSGLPPGLTLDVSSGLISGTLPYTAAGVYSTTLAVSDSRSTTYTFLTWTVTNTSLMVTPIVIAANRPYDGTPGATLASCTLSGLAGPGLVAAYSFDEGAGNAAMDSSGHGHHGALVNATWTVRAGAAAPSRSTASTHESGFPMRRRCV